MTKRRGDGEGCITKRKDGRWQGSVLTGYDPETGYPVRKYFYGKTRQAVQAKVTELSLGVQTGTYREPTKLTVAEWFTTWLDNYAKITLRPSTWKIYFYKVNRHIIPVLGHLRLPQLQTAHIQRLYNSKLEGGRLDGKPGGLSPKTIRHIHTVIHSALAQARAEGLIAINPAGAVKLPKCERSEVNHLSAEDVRAFLSAARDQKYFAAYFLALNTGMRRGEILGLRWQDIDLDAGHLTVNQGLVRVNGKGLLFQPPKTKLSNRTISLGPAAVQALREHRREQAQQKLIAGGGYDAEGLNLVFANEIGFPICPREFARAFEQITTKADLDITLHGLRHTFATLALEEGVDIKTIQETLGHYSAALTLDIYSRATEKTKREAAQKIDNLLASLL